MVQEKKLLNSIVRVVRDYEVSIRIETDGLRPVHLIGCGPTDARTSSYASKAVRPRAHNALIIRVHNEHETIAVKNDSERLEQGDCYIGYKTAGHGDSIELFRFEKLNPIVEAIGDV